MLLRVRRLANGGAQWTSASGGGYAGASSDGITGYASAVPTLKSFLWGINHASQRKISKSDADLRVVTAKLIRKGLDCYAGKA